MDFKQILDIIQSLGIIASITFAVFSIRDTRRKAKADIISRVYSKMDLINTLHIQHPEFRKKLSSEFDAQSQYESVNAYVDIVITFCQELFYHHQMHKQLGLQEWNAQVVTMKKYFTYPYVRGYWEHTKVEYHPDFSMFIDSITK